VTRTLDVRQLIVLALQASIFLTVFGFGLLTRWIDLVSVFGRPLALLRALFSMFIVMPAVAAALCMVFHLHPAVEIALAAISVSPTPPLIPNREMKAGGRAAWGIGLMTVTTALSIGIIPFALPVVGRVLGSSMAMTSASPARLVALSVIVPLGSGMTVKAALPGIAARIHQPVVVFAILVLIVSASAVLIAVLPASLLLIGNGTLLALALFVVMGIAVGHVLGGADPEDRVALALSTGCRHPGMAIAIAAANFPAEGRVVAAALLYLNVNVTISIAYVVRMRLKSA
jgi:BASS family bile acid:Na+ symporter